MTAGFVNRYLALAYLFLVPFRAFFASRPPAFRRGLAGFREAAIGFRDDFLAFGLPPLFLIPLEAAFFALAALLGAFLAAPRPEAVDFEAHLVAAFAGFFAALAGFFAPLASTAPIATRMRSISWVTCSIAIMPSTVSNLRRSE